MIRSLLLMLALACAATAAQAQLRAIPADAKRAVLVPVSGMTVQLDGKQVELAAGAQVRDIRNLIVLPNALPKEALVKYQVDLQGQVWRVWILSPEEAAQPDPKK
jgi:hypothetical protein